MNDSYYFHTVQHSRQIAIVATTRLRRLHQKAHLFQRLKRSTRPSALLPRPQHTPEIITIQLGFPLTRRKCHFFPFGHSVDFQGRKALWPVAFYRLAEIIYILVGRRRLLLPHERKEDESIILCCCDCQLQLGLRSGTMTF